MQKYTVEVQYTTTRLRTFEVIASDNAEAIAKAEAEAANFDFNQVTGQGEYEGTVLHSVGDLDLSEGDECPECGSPLIDGPNKLECPNCGKFF